MTENGSAGRGSNPQRYRESDRTAGNGHVDGEGYAVDNEDKNFLMEDPDAKSRKRKIVILVVVLALLALAAGGYLAIRIAGGDNDVVMTEDGPEAPTDRLPDVGEQIPPRDGESPFAANIDPESVNLPDQTFEVTTDDNAFNYSVIDMSLAVDEDEGTVVETEGKECSMSNDNEICYAGYVEFEDENMDDLEVFAVRNIVENRLFESTSDVVATEVAGTEHAFVGNIVIDTQEYSVPFFAVAGDNGAGFMMMLSDEEGRSVEDFNGYQPALSVEQ